RLQITKARRTRRLTRTSRVRLKAGAGLSDAFVSCAHVAGWKLLRKRTIASGGPRTSAGKSIRERQRSPQVGRDRETCGHHRQVAAKRFPPPSRVFAAQWFPACALAHRDKLVLAGLPLSRPMGASASLAGAFGVGGKACTTPQWK